MSPLTAKLLEQIFNSLKGQKNGVIKGGLAMFLLLLTSFGTFTLADCKTTACKDCVLKCLEKQDADGIKICVKHCLKDLAGEYD